MIDGLLRQIRASGAIPAQLGLNGQFEPALVREVLQHLGAPLGCASHRRAHRRAIAFWPPRTWRTASTTCWRPLPARPGDAQDEVTEAWTVENESAGGFGAVLPAARRGLAGSGPSGCRQARLALVLERGRDPSRDRRAARCIARSASRSSRAAACASSSCRCPPALAPCPCEAFSFRAKPRSACSGGEVRLVLPQGIAPPSSQPARCAMHDRPYRVARPRIADSGKDFEIARFAASGCR